MLSLLLATHLALAPCKPPESAIDVQCGKLTVFEDRARHAGRTINLNVVVIPALDPKNKREPLFPLDGGPGRAATASVALWTHELRAYGTHRDIVLVDQRGTGGSNGLDCKHEGTRLQLQVTEMFPLSYVRRCREELARRADLRLYTTPLAMDDLDDVRAALGYDKIDLEGTSYGTRAALVYARQHPSHVNRIVLIGATPVWASLPLYHSANAQHAIELLFDEAKADYPNLRTQFRQVLDHLPAKIESKGETVTLTAPVFAEQIRKMLYFPMTARAVPKVIDWASRGDFRPYLTVTQPASGSGDGMYFSVTCAEDVPRIRSSDAKRLSEGTYFGDDRIRQQQRACAEWPRGSLPADYWDDVRSDAPTLIFTGRLDPVSAPAWADAIAKHLTHARNIVVPEDAHLPIGLSNLECWERIETEFLDGGNPDASCVSTMKPPPFAK